MFRKFYVLSLCALFALSSANAFLGSFSYFAGKAIEKALKKDGKSVPEIRKMTRLRPAGEAKLSLDAMGKKRIEKLGGKPDFKQAYLWWFEQRAYPFGFIDWNAYELAAAHRDAMEPARKSIPKHISIGRVGVGGSLWETSGPRDLDIPYQIYYGQPPLSGRVNAIAIDPTNPNVWFIGAATGGVWKIERIDPTTFNVTPLSDGWESLAVNAIAFDPTNNQVIYVGTGDFNGGYPYSFGIMKSINGGASWVNLGRNQFGGCAVRKILVAPDDPNIVIVAAGRGKDGATALWRSTNGGTTWAKAINENRAWTDVECGIPDGQGVRAYYACGEGTNGVYRSLDKGATWTVLTTPLGNSWVDGIEIATSKTDPNTVYLLSGVTAQIFKSTDRGNTWSSISAGFPNGAGYYNWSQWWYDFYIHCDVNPSNNNDLVMVGLIDIVMSPNGGSTWQSIGKTYQSTALTHNDQHAIAFNPPNGNNVEAIFGNDGGVFILNYDASTNTWSINPEANTDLITTQFYAMDWHPSSVNHGIGGTQDNATPWSNGNLNAWDNVGGGDGGFCAISQSNPANQFATSQFLGVYKTTNSWTSSSNITPNIGSDNVGFIAPITLDPNNEDLLYAGTNYLWKYTSSTNTWTPRLGNTQLTGSGGYLTYIAVAPGNGNRIYTGSVDGKAFMTTNGGTSWTEITSGFNSLPNRAITCIAVNPNDMNDVIVTVSGTNSGHVWHCTDVTSSSRFWQDISGNLPNIPVNSLVRHPNRPNDTLFVATDVGVFFTTDGGTSWVNATASLGLPNVQFNTLKYRPLLNMLYAASWGRGIWGLDLDNPGLNDLKVIPNKLMGGSSGQGSVELDRPTGSSAFSVTLTSSNPAVLQVPPDVTINPGERTGSFIFTTSQTTGISVVTITASVPNGQISAQVTVVPLIPKNLKITPQTVSGGTNAIGEVTLNAAAGTGGVTVNLISSNTNVATVPPSVFIPEGQTSNTFIITTFPVKATTKAKISASLNGGRASADIEVTPPMVSKLTLNPQTVPSNSQSIGTVYLTGPAPDGGSLVTLKSGDPKLAMVPDSVLVPQGETSASFVIKTGYTNVTKGVAIFATKFKTVYNILKVTPP